MIPIELPHLSGQILTVYTEIKYWLTVAAAVWPIFKIVSWVKKIKETDIVNLQTGVSTLNHELVKQTSAIVNELKEMRADFRTFYIPALAVQPARMRAARTRKEKPEKTEAEKA